MKAVVVAGGQPDPADAALLGGASLVIAADSGARWLAEMGRRPDILVGDLDSLSDDEVERLAGAGVEVERHPAAKDASDAELALDRALERGAQEVVVIGALGGTRVDHELANLLLLVDPQVAKRDVRLVRGATSVRAVRPGAALALGGRAGDGVTLLPLGGDVAGVRTRGLRYPLDGETLRLGRSRGLSNEVVAAPASVQVEGGTLLVVETRSGGAS